MKYFKLILTVISLLYSINALPHDFEVEGIYYKIISSSEKTLKVSYKGNDSYSYSNEYKGDVSIPDKVHYNGIDYTVIEIQSSAFEGCSELTSIHIPASITKIGSYAFSSCDSLRSVHIVDIVSWSKIEFGSFANPIYYAHNLYLNEEMIIDLILPEGLDKVGNYAFMGLSSVQKVVLPQSLESIGIAAFLDCSNMTNINIPNNVASIGNNAFRGCVKLSTIVIEDGESVLSIGHDTSSSNGKNLKFLSDCPIKQLYIGRELSYNSSEEYGLSPFCNCTELTTLTLGKHVKTLKENVFSGCSNLSSIIIPSNVTSIGNKAFDKCNSLRSVIIEDCGEDLSMGYSVKMGSWTSEGKGLFYDCPIDTLYLGRDLAYSSDKNSGYSPFANNESVRSVTISDSVTNINEYLFHDCKELKEITIGNQVKSMGSGAFYGCDKLNKVFISSLFSWCNITFDLNSSNPLSHAKTLYLNGQPITDLKVPDGVETIKSFAFYGCSELESIYIPRSVKQIGNNVFTNCTNVKSLIIEDGLDDIICGYDNYISYSTGKACFFDCPLEQLYLGRNITYNAEQNYGYSPFYNKTTLTSLEIGDSVTCLNKNLFSKCTNIESVTIPKSIKKIEIGVFDGCTALSKINIQDLSSWCNITFGFRSNPLNIAKHLYLNNELLTHVVIPKDVKEIKEYSFSGCTSIKTIELHDSIARIGDDAFSRCSSLTDINIPNSVTDINGAAFYECTKLSSIKLGEGLVNIVSNAFFGCTSLRKVINFSNLNIIAGSEEFGYVAKYADVVVSQNDERVDDFFFRSKDNDNVLIAYIGHEKTVTPPSNYKNQNYRIGKSAFASCSELYSISIPTCVTSIDDYAFSNCYSLKKVTIETGDSILTMGYNGWEKGLFYDCPLEEITILRNIIYGTNLTQGYSPFYNKETLEEIKFGDNVTMLPNAAFEGTMWYQKQNNGVVYIGRILYKYKGVMPTNSNITLKEGTKGVAGLAFKDCSNLNSISFPNSVVYIGSNAFNGCLNLTSIFIPDGVKHVGDYSFANCTNLNKVHIGNDVDNIKSCTFENCSNLKELKIGSGIKQISYSSFSGCNALELIEFNCETIDDWFYGYTSIEKVIIGPNVCRIEDDAFHGCSSIKDVCIEDGENVLSMGFNYKNSFINDYGLFCECPIETLYLGRNLLYERTTYGHSPFSGNTLKYITIGSCVKELGVSLFAKNYNLKSVKSLIPADKLFVPASSAFLGIEIQNCVLYVPYGAKSKYKSTDIWKDFGSVVEVAEKYAITYIIDGEFFAKEMVAEGSVIQLPEVPQRDGYIFSWDNAPRLMPSYNITIYGSYMIDSSICNVEELDDNLIIYDIRGFRTNKDELKNNCIYIVNGKKVYIK
jgi:hypothetical protein